MLLQKRNENEYVGILQRRLRDLGLYTGAIDNDYWTKTYDAVKAYQRRRALGSDGKAGEMTLKSLGIWDEITGEAAVAPNAAALVCEERTLTEADMLHMIDVMSVFEGKPWSTNKDYEFKGWFDRPKKLGGRKLDPAERAQQNNHRPNGFSRYGKSPGHVGLSWGFIQFTQDSGTLGKVLQAAYDRDARAFSMAFEGPANALALLKVVTAKGTKKKVKDTGSPTGYARRSPRVQPIGGVDIWESPWVERFTAAGKTELFQWAQKRVAVDLYFKSMLRKSATPYGIRSQKGLTILVDRTVQLGGGGCAKLLKSHWKGGNEEEAFKALYRKIKSRSWSHRMEKLIETNKLSWELAFEF